MGGGGGGRGGGGGQLCCGQRGIRLAFVQSTQ